MVLLTWLEAVLKMGMLSNQLTPQMLQQIDEWKKYVLLKEMQAKQMAQQGLLRGTELVGQGMKVPVDYAKDLWSDTKWLYNDTMDRLKAPPEPSDLGSGLAAKAAEYKVKRKRESEKIQ
jgi:hypothetical protein